MALGVGQGALAILAFLPEGEREEVIRFNLSRVREYGVYDEVYLRTEIERVRQQGYAGRNTGLLEGMAGVAVPVCDREGRAVAALSVGTIADRLNPDRMPTVVDLLQREAAAIGPLINPFDPTLRRPARNQRSPKACIAATGRRAGPPQARLRPLGGQGGHEVPTVGVKSTDLAILTIAQRPERRGLCRQLGVRET